MADTRFEHCIQFNIGLNLWTKIGIVTQQQKLFLSLILLIINKYMLFPYLKPDKGTSTVCNKQVIT